MLRLGVVVLLAGCDALFGLEELIPDDGAKPCAIGTPFARGTPVAIDGTYSVEAARFNPPRSIAYLSLCPGPGQPDAGDKTQCELYSSPFLPTTSAFGAFAKITGISTANAYDAYPTITPDGRHILFGSERGGGEVQVFVASAVNGSFDAPVIAQLSLVAGAEFGNEPYILGDGRTIYFSAGNHGDGLGWQLYHAVGDPPTFGNSAMLVTGVNTTNGEFAPVVTDDELEIFFASDRGGAALDVYTSTRSDRSQPFPTPVVVSALSAGGNDWPLWISSDACDLYYINKTSGTNGIATLYVAHR
jgi:hypothetical protein